MTWKPIKNLMSSWWFNTVLTLIVSFAIPLILPHTQMTKVIENLLYPESGWVGAMTFRLNDVPGYSGRNDLDLILLTHHFDDTSRVTFLRNGPRPESVAAGAPVSLMLDRPKARTSGLPLFDVDLPPKTLVATSVAAPRGSPPSRYTMITSAQYSKELGGNADLIVLTPNELLNTRINYGLCLVALGLAAIFMPRFAHLLHPEEEEEALRSSEGADDSG